MVLLSDVEKEEPPHTQAPTLTTETHSDNLITEIDLKQLKVFSSVTN